MVLCVPDACWSKILSYLWIHEWETINGNNSTRDITDFETLDSCTAEDLAHDALKILSMSNYIYDGISTNELCRILKEKFGTCQTLLWYRVETENWAGYVLPGSPALVFCLNWMSICYKLNEKFSNWNNGWPKSLTWILEDILLGKSVSIVLLFGPSPSA